MVRWADREIAGWGDCRIWDWIAGLSDWIAWIELPIAPSAIPPSHHQTIRQFPSSIPNQQSSHPDPQSLNPQSSIAWRIAELSIAGVRLDAHGDPVGDDLRARIAVQRGLASRDHAERSDHAVWRIGANEGAQVGFTS